MTSDVHESRLKSILLVVVIILSATNNFFGVFLSIGLYFIIHARSFLVLPKSPLLILALVPWIHLIVPSELDPQVRIEDAMRFSGLAAFGFLILRAKSVKFTIDLIAMVLIVLAVLFLFAGAFGRYDESGDYRYTSFLVHPNHVGYVCVPLILYYLNRYTYGIGAGRTNLLFILGLLFALVLCESSNAFITLILSLATYFIVSASTGTQLLGRLMAFGLVAVMLPFTPLAVDLASKVANVNFDAIRLGSYSFKFGGHDSSLAWRLSYWTAIIREHFSQPLTVILFGNGGGSTSFGNYVYFFMYKDPHNDYLAFIIDYGLVFGSALILAIVQLSRKASHALPFFIAILLPMMTGNISSSFSVMSIYLLAVYGTSNTATKKNPQGTGHNASPAPAI